MDEKTAKVQLHGRGRIEFPASLNTMDAVSAEGFFDNGSLNGWGCILFNATDDIPSGSMLHEGQMRNDKLHGIGKTMKLFVKREELRAAKEHLKVIKEKYNRVMQVTGPDTGLAEEIKVKTAEINDMYTLCKGYFQHGLPRSVVYCGRGHTSVLPYMVRKEYNAYKYAEMSAKIKVLWDIVRSKRLGLVHPIAYYWFSLIHRPDAEGKAPQRYSKEYEQDF